MTILRTIRTGAVIIGIGTLTTIGLATAAVADAPPTNFVVNGNFAEPHVDSGGFIITTAPGWVAAVGDGIEVDNSSAPYFTVPAGSVAGTQLIDLNTTVPTTVEQTISTVPGTTYTLEFDLSGNPDGTLQKTGDVTIAGTTHPGALDFDSTGRSNVDMGWIHRSIMFTATADSTTIGFASTMPGAYGTMITNVAVTAPADAGAPMVSPEALGIIGGGAMLTWAVWFVTRRRTHSLDAA